MATTTKKKKRSKYVYAVGERCEDGEFSLKNYYPTRAEANEAMEILEAQTSAFEDLGYEDKMGMGFDWIHKKMLRREAEKEPRDETNFFDLMMERTREPFDKLVREYLEITQEAYEALLERLDL